MGGGGGEGLEAVVNETEDIINKKKACKWNILLAISIKGVVSSLVAQDCKIQGQVGLSFAFMDHPQSHSVFPFQ